MTRFEKEINGVLGDWWKEHALKEVEEAAALADKDAIVEDNGAIKWKCNGRYLMDDLCEKLEYAGYEFSRKETKKAREAQVNEELTEYKKRNAQPTDEALFEMRATFGEGTEVVNIITGEKITI